MGKINVNSDTCIGCGACIAIDSEHFDFNDEGKSSVIKQDNFDTDELKNAISSCPVSAISLEKGCDCGDECKCGDDCQCGDDCACHKK